MMTGIVQTLVNASERAACVARACVGLGEDALLVTEKSEGEANTRFEKDFKTIADVLAQEAAKLTISENFPMLSNHIRGEECTEIAGKKIKIEESEEQTVRMLRSFVSSSLAEKMAEAAHSDVQHVHAYQIPDNIGDLNVADLGIWIDPIDGTAEFISGVRGEANAEGGLNCVTVLVGAYLRSTGEPVIGVINQPFHGNGRGRLFWGMCSKNASKWGGTHISMTKDSNVLLMSSADTIVKQMFAKSKYRIETMPGAGNKLMHVCLGDAEAYLLTKGTTYLWDTCAAHAIIKAKGGDVLNYVTGQSIKYNIPHSPDNQIYCNSDGIIAYCDNKVIRYMTPFLK
ncbi:hypothetical protein ACJJTC_013721 [Scirpophaga incertulas]